MIWRASAVGVALAIAPTAAYAHDLSPLAFLWAIAVVAGPALGAGFKHTVLRGAAMAGRSRRWRLALVAAGEFVTWGLVFPAVLVLRLGGHWVYRSYWVPTALLVLAVAFLLNRVVLFPDAGPTDLRSAARALAFAVSVPAIAILVALLTFMVLGWLG